MRQVELPFVIPACNEEDSIEDALGTLDGVARNCVWTSLFLGINDPLTLRNEHQHSSLIKTH